MKKLAITNGDMVFVIVEECYDGSHAIDSVWKDEESARERLRTRFLELVDEYDKPKVEWVWANDGMRCYHDYVSLGLEIVEKTVGEVLR